MRDNHAEILKQAQLLHKDNRIRAATKAYRDLISLEPNHPIALNNLASIYIERGDLEASLTLLSHASEMHPTYSDALSNLAVANGMLGRWQDCLQWAHQAIKQNKGSSSAWLWRSRAEAALDNHDKAIQVLEQALCEKQCSEIELIATEYIEIASSFRQQKRAIRTLTEIFDSKSLRSQRHILELLHSLCRERRHAEQLFHRSIDHANGLSDTKSNLLFWKANKLLREDDERSAIEALMQVVRIDPSHDGAWLNLGIILKKQKNFHKAIACLKRAIGENSKNTEAWKELTTCLTQNREYREAIKQSALARRYFPKNAEILASHCHALIDGGKPGLALTILKSFASSFSDAHNANLLNCMGLAFLQLKDYNQAIKTFALATSTARADAGIWNNRGVAYGMAGRARPEVHCYRRAIACNPDDPGSHVNLAMAYMAQQKFEAGLREYEWRLRSSNASLNTLVNGSLADRNDQPEKLLVICEQGLGDTLQFCRYLYDLRHKLTKTRLTLICPEKLRDILSDSISAVDAVVSCEANNYIDVEEAYIPLMSLPYFCEIHPHRSRAPKAYIQVNEDFRQDTRRLVREGVPESALVIGLNWKGNPETERSNLKGRSMALEDMSALADMLPNAMFVSLQKGAGSEELDYCSFRERFISNQNIVSAELCFRHAAAFCLACDYVVTTDTSLAHLSGAIGQHTKLLLTSKPEWRWRHCDQRSPWYANTDVFLQKDPGIWLSPLSAVAQQIRTNLDERSQA